MSSNQLSSITKRVRGVYNSRTLLDSVERGLRKAREKLFSVDCTVFDKTIAYYEFKGQQFTHETALQRALDKQRHKNSWSTKTRSTENDIFSFYQEVDVYPFRQPYLKRFGGFRWYMHLVKHIPNPRVLEYGCGSAVLTEYLMSHFPHAKYTVADIPSTTLDFVMWKKVKYNYPIEILTIGPGKEGIPLDDKYDLIVCQDVLEHTPNPVEIVEAFVRCLDSRGILVIDFLDAPGGENLPAAVAQREAVKAFLKTKLHPIKAIDEPSGNNGLYMNPDA